MRYREFITENDDYRGDHTAPNKESGAPLHDVTANGIYPEDVYSHNGFTYYGDQGNDYDFDSFYKMKRMRNKPDNKVWIYRAIPKSVYDAALKKDAPLSYMIRPGDWVTLSKDYAREHGESNLRGDFKVVGSRVLAKHLYTDGNSHHEWGYYPD